MASVWRCFLSHTSVKGYDGPLRMFLSLEALDACLRAFSPWLSCSLSTPVPLDPPFRSLTRGTSCSLLPLLSTCAFFKEAGYVHAQAKGMGGRHLGIRSFGEKSGGGGGFLAALGSCSPSPWDKHWLLHQWYQELTLLGWPEIASPWAQGAGHSCAQQLGGKSIMSLV